MSNPTTPTKISSGTSSPKELSPSSPCNVDMKTKRRLSTSSEEDQEAPKRSKMEDEGTFMTLINARNNLFG